MRHICIWLILSGFLYGNMHPVYASPGAQGVNPRSTNQGDFTPYDEVNSWLLNSLKEDGANTKTGRFTFLMGMFTGSITSNPLNGEAMRRAVSVWLNTTMTHGDHIQIVGYEHNVWYRSPLFTLSNFGKEREDVFSALPFSPEPNSKGGKNIEQVMLSLARMAGSNSKGHSPVIILLSNGFSQTPMNVGDGKLYQNALFNAGYHSSKLQIFRFIVHGYVQDVYAFLAIPLDIQRAAAASARYPGFAPESWVPYAYEPAQAAKATGASVLAKNGVQAISGSAQQETPIWTWIWFVLAAGITLVFGLFVARSKVIPEREPIHSDTESSTSEPEQDQAELKKTLQEARRHEKSLDILSQDMAATIANLAPIIPSAQEQGKLRNEIASLQQQLKDWDDASMDFLDAVQRGLSMPAIAQEIRDTWIRAGMEFARQAARNGFEVINPKAGEPFVEGLHRLLNDNITLSASVRIGHCVQWGYRRGSHVYSPAIVEVNSQDSEMDKGETQK